MLPGSTAHAQIPAYQSCDSGQDYSLGTCGSDRPRPQISATPATPHAGATVHLSAYARSNGLTYAWDLDDDGAFDDSTSATPQKVFATAGSHTIRVAVTDSDGRVGSTSREFKVHDASANIAPDGTLQIVQSFIRPGAPATARVYASDVDDQIASIDFDLDGAPGFETSETDPVALANGGVDRVFTANATRTIRARIVDEAGEATIVEREAAILTANRIPAVSLYVPWRARPGQETSVSAYATDLDGQIANYKFDLNGDGTYETDMGTESTAPVTFPTGGTLEVGVLVTDDQGATAAARRSVTMRDANAAPNVSLYETETPGQFQAYGYDNDGELVEYAWDLDGDGVFDDLIGLNATIASVPDPAASQFEVAVRVTDDEGAIGTQRRIIRRRAPQQPLGVRVMPTGPVRVGNQAYLSAQADTTVAEWAWDLDDDGQFDDANSSYAPVTFDSPGDHRVRVRATQPGTDPVAVQAVVSVSPSIGPALPRPDFTFSPTAPRTAMTVTFTNDSVTGDGIETRAWDVDGDGFDDGSGQTASTSFATAGSYLVALKVTDGSGHSSIQRRTIVVHSGNIAPQARISAAGYFTSDEQITVDTGTTISLDSAESTGVDDGIAARTWDLNGDTVFGDSTSAATSTSFASPGLHRVRLRVTDSGGALDEAVLIFNAVTPSANRPPDPPTINAPTKGRPNRLIKFSAYGDDPDNDPVSLAWDLDDDGQFDDGSGQQASTTFSTAGLKRIHLRASDGKGGVRGVLSSVVIADEANLPPVLESSFLYGTVPVGQPVSLYPHATDPDDPNADEFSNSNITYVWDLDGDGQFDDVPLTGPYGQLSWVFATANPVTVRLKATDADGASTSVSRTVAPSSTDIAPDVAIYMRGELAAGQVMRIVSYISESGVTVAWDLDGDGQYDDATKRTVYKAFSAGERSIGIQVTDTGGNIVRTRQTFTVGSRRPTASFTSDHDADYTIAPGETVVFTSTATDPDADAIVTRTWDLDNDGQFDDATGATVNKTFGSSASATVYVGQKVKDASGDVGIRYTGYTLLQTDAPHASFTSSPTRKRPGAQITFTSTSTDPQGDNTITSHDWDLDDDGAYDDATGPLATTAFNAGNHSVHLRVTDADGHTDVSSTTVAVLSNVPPTVTLTKDVAAPTVGQPVTFTVSALDVDGTINAREVTGEDGTTAPQAGPTFTRMFANAGSKTISFRATDDEAATQQVSLTFEVAAAVNPQGPAAPRPDPAAGTGPPTPPGTAADLDTAPPTLSVIPVAGSAARLGAVLSRGLGLTVASSEPGTLSIRLTVGSATARTLGLGKTTLVGKLSQRLTAAGKVHLRIRLAGRAAKAVRKRGRLKLKATVVASDLSGNSTTRSVSVTLRR